MKILGIALIVLTVFAVVFWIFFYYSVRVARETVTLPQATSTATSSTKPLLKVATPTMTPISSHGPTNVPHIIGPSGPPPNY